MKVAETSAVVTWKYGLLRQGSGLSQGIAGNGYLMHNIYRAYTMHAALEINDDKKEKFSKMAEKWRTRVFLFANAINDDKKESLNPYSLLDWISGEIAFLTDLCSYENAVRFPGFELVQGSMNLV